MFTINHDYRSVTYLEKDMLIIDRDRKYISFRQDKIIQVITHPEPSTNPKITPLTPTTQIRLAGIPYTAEPQPTPSRAIESRGIQDRLNIKGTNALVALSTVVR